MGIQLYFSNQLLSLAERLQENLIPPDGMTAILRPPMVIVPNMNLAKWLKLTLSRNATICMNLNLQYLEAGLWQILQTLDPQSASAPLQVDAERLTIILFFILMNAKSDAHTPAFVQRYLAGVEGETAGDTELRAWQLAETLSRLYQEYEYHRDDMIQRWLLGDGVDADPMEDGQCWIYRKTVALRKALANLTGQSLFTLAEYANHLFGTKGTPLRSLLTASERVHLFGLSQVSPLHVQVLGRLGAYYDIHIYSLNPSREYWEDIRTPAEEKWIQRRSVVALKPHDEEWAAGELFNQPAHPLLSAWGKPGRENIRLLCQLTDYDFFASFEDPDSAESVLAAIRRGILTLDPAPLDRQQDRSLQITACPGIRREVESVYHSILYNLEADDTLCMTDIAVLVSDMTRYKPVVDSVFNRQPSQISYSLVDARASSDSVLAQAILSLMTLAQGPFSRQAVFDLLRNPCVMQQWDYGPEALTIWIEWADALGVYHDFAKPDDSVNDGPEVGRYTWRQGMERMRLARIMTAPVDAAEGSAPHFQGLVPFANIHTGDERLLEKFCRLIVQLWESVAALQIPEATVQAWRDTFFSVLDTLVAFNDDMRGEETVYQSLMDAFDRLEQYDILNQVSGGRKMTPAALWAFVRRHFDGVFGGRGDYLTGGVTVSALMPMRPIPFKVVYVLGLEEGRFPGRASDTLLDLRHRKRRIGDVSLTERNRYLFLEILLSVQSKLYLSYICRDLQKDRDLSPCSVLLQLQRYMEQHILGGQRSR
ncbi:exodeoxyribonuclease V subunit gamma [Desulfosarcina cetonica]|uniref:exodeoxyribonuclease V subunit gamma n=1 Tax=Desulfosarcina cetonica TaxID=90730 RepID=UPI0006D02EAA|nr:exodeoxyribonuclease V subunit gamma [Desulfosarcina cetonica]